VENLLIWGKAGRLVVSKKRTKHVIFAYRLHKIFEELFTEGSEVSQMELIEPSTAK
jgi:hypothetical protein